MHSKINLILKALKEVFYKPSGGYKFSLYDFFLFLYEYISGVPKVAVTESDTEYSIVNVKGLKVVWPATADHKDLGWLYKEIFSPYFLNPSSYCHPKIKWYEKDWIMDAGCCEGYFSISALRKSNSSTRLLCIEPSSQLCSAVEKSFKLNALSHRDITVLPVGLSNIRGEAYLSTNLDCLSDNVVSHEETSEIIKLDTIDSISQEFQLGDNGHIKMDIEGFEMLALKGATNLLKTKKPTLSIAVYHGLENANECAYLIKKANPSYKIYMRGCYGYFTPPRPFMLFAI